MKTCDWTRDRLDDYADGELGTDEVREVDVHLESCDACRAEWESLQSLLEEAGALPKRIEPGRDLWPTISSELERSRGVVVDWRRHARAAAFALAIAAMAVVAVSIGLTQLSNVRDTAAAPSVARGVERPEPLQEDRSVLREAYLARADALDPDLRSVIDSNLTIIDQSLNEIRRAMELSPDNPELEQLYMTACLSEVEMLRQVVHSGSEG